MHNSPSGWTVMLGPGLAAGFSGLGALVELERRSIPVVRVIGLNSGAFAAAMWAAQTDLLMAGRVAAHLPWDRFIGEEPRAGSLDPLLGALLVLTRELAFEDCQRRISVVAVDLENGDAVHIERGSLARAVRHSMAIPGIFEPLSEGGRRYADGGLAAKERLEQMMETSPGRSVAFWPRVALNRKEAGDHLADRIAAYAARAWGEGPRGGTSIVSVVGPAASPADFSAIPEWIDAGRRAAADWLAISKSTSGDGGRT